jgi:uncharacterized membrane protein (GlpM family)
MSPELFFWYGLVLKAAMTATIVVIVSVAAERSGPFVAALIAALPTAAGATYIILAFEHPPAFIAAAAIGSMAANAAVAIFALSTALAQRQGIVLSIAVATLVWFGIAAVLRLVEWTPATALVLNAVVFAFTIPLSARYRDAAVPRNSVRRTRYDIPLRAAAAALVVAAVTTASHWIGSFASGVFAVFPIVLATFVVIMHPRAGGKAAAAVLAHAQPVLVGLPLGFLGVHCLAGWIGVVVARGWPCDLDVVERRALARATSAAAHRLTGRAALLLDGELLLVDHLGPFAGLGLDVIGELFR